MDFNERVTRYLAINRKKKRGKTIRNGTKYNMHYWYNSDAKKYYFDFEGDESYKTKKELFARMKEYIQNML